MTTFPIDLVLHDGWKAEDVITQLGDIHPGQKLALNIIPAGPFEAAGFEPVLKARNTIECVTLRLTSTSELPAALTALAACCKTLGVDFSVDFLLDEADDVPDCVIDKTGQLHRVLTATADLRAQGHQTRWLIPLTPALVYRLEFLVSLARKNDAAPVLLPASALGMSDVNLSPEDRLFAWDFVIYRLLGEDIDLLPQSRIACVSQLCAMLSELPPPASKDLWGVLDSAAGYSETPRAEAALGAALLRPDPPNPEPRNKGEVLKEKLADIADVLRYGLPGHIRAYTVPAGKPGSGDPKMPFVLLIGAYGGEHIGDAAILGGVLHRIHARHGTTDAILMTQRPYHTRHLIPMLDVPVRVEVQEYTAENITAALARANGVVFAGGPLTDLPKQLVRHLETVTRAKRRGLPFIMEGIGPGTFVRKPSEITARRLVKLADRIAIRVRDDAKRDIIQGCEIEIGRDPAFDYLETRAATLTRLPGHEPAEIDALLADTQGRPVIGINVRPIGSLFTPAEPGRDPVTYTQAVEDQFERELAQGLMKFASQSKARPCFVYFPMNAIQFGMSDLRSAWRIMQHLEPGVDFRIWQADASLDGVVALLRRMDVAISMRFHGAIFALSQDCPVIGIDYRIGKRDKVAAVLSDAGVEENCSRIDELRADWLAERLQTLCPAKTG